MSIRPIVRRNAGLLAAIVTLCTMYVLWLNVFPAWAERVRAAPLDHPIVLTTSSVVEREIEILAPERYRLVLRFPGSESLNDDQVERIIGRFTQPESGLPVSLKWTLHDAETGIQIDAGDTTVRGGSRRSGRLVDVVPVPSTGPYLIRVEILSDAPELQRLRPRIAFELSGKADSSWQMALLWFATPITLVFVLPGLIVAVVVLLGREFRRLEPVDPARPPRRS